MTKQEAMEAAEVLRAYGEGREIEFWNSEKNEWLKGINPTFNFALCQYRVKPEPPAIDWGKSWVGKRVKNKTSKTETMIIRKLPEERLETSGGFFYTEEELLDSFYVEGVNDGGQR